MSAPLTSRVFQYGHLSVTACDQLTPQQYAVLRTIAEWDRQHSRCTAFEVAFHLEMAVEDVITVVNSIDDSLIARNFSSGAAELRSKVDIDAHYKTLTVRPNQVQIPRRGGGYMRSPKIVLCSGNVTVAHPTNTIVVAAKDLTKAFRNVNPRVRGKIVPEGESLFMDVPLMKPSERSSLRVSGHRIGRGRKEKGVVVLERVDPGVLYEGPECFRDVLFHGEPSCGGAMTVEAATSLHSVIENGLLPDEIIKSGGYRT